MSKENREYEEFPSNPIRQYTPPEHTDIMILLKTAENQGIGNEKHIREEIAAEQERARQFLQEMAQPFFAKPPQEQWSPVIYPKGKSLELVRVPFSQKELNAIAQARKAKRDLTAEKTIKNDAIKEFIIESQFFPEEFNTDNSTLSGLQYRAPSVWEIFVVARAAENALTFYTNTPKEPPQKAKRPLLILQNLPDKLIRHPLPSKL